MAPHSVAASTRRVVYGDFVMPVDSVSLPVAAFVGDTLRLIPHFGSGVDPCTGGAVVWETDATGVFLTFYGVRNPAPTCRTPEVSLIADPSWARTGPDADAAVERATLLFVCGHDGEVLVQQLAVRRRADDPAWPEFQPTAIEPWNVRDSLRASADARCGRARSAVR